MDLNCELSGRGDDDGTHVVTLGRLFETQQFLDDGQEECQSLSTSRDSLKVIELVGISSGSSGLPTSTTTSLFPRK